MSAQQMKCAVIALQWTLGIVILIEAVLFVLPGAAHGFASTHMPNFIRLVLGFGEIAGCLLMLYPRTTKSGAWFLMAVFVLALMIHILHGMYNVGNLTIYIAASGVVATGSRRD